MNFEEKLKYFEGVRIQKPLVPMVVVSQRMTAPITDILQAVTRMKEKPGDRIQFIRPASISSENGKVQKYNGAHNNQQNCSTGKVIVIVAVQL